MQKGNAAFYWVGTNTGKAYWQYEFDLQVVDNQNNGAPLQGARYRIYDKNGNELTKTGSGYTSVPNVSLSAPPEGGTQATAHAVLDPNGQGAITSFVIDNPGSGYVIAAYCNCCCACKWSNGYGISIFDWWSCFSYYADNLHRCKR